MLHPREVLLDEFCVNSKGVIDWHSMEILRGGILEVVQVGMGVNEDQLEILAMGLYLSMDGSQGQGVVASDGKRESVLDL